ncbi:MAG: SusF/SusE family outer membrane protein [Bacteroidaceae bacterium]|nr:SusF/SusE family outer membrane protein [Bacteroidaceae bacterium]
MKKLLFSLLLAAVTLPGWAEELYLVGDATALGEYVWGNPRSPYKLKETGADTNIYKWTGLLKSGDFKICTGLQTWDAYHPKSENQSDNFEISDTEQEITTDGTNDRKWVVVNPGIFEVTVDLSQETKTVVFTPQWTDISTADELITFAESVNSATEDNYNAARWARLTADIDMSGKTFPGIGLDSKWQRYHGTFDGQGHKISNLNMTSEYCAFVTIAGGGCTVKNLLIDSTCEFNATGRVAAFISACNYSDFGVPVTIECCGNEANVTGTGSNCAGLLGCNYGNGIVVTIKNSFNTGNVSSTGNESAPISGWLGSSATVENTYNIGSIDNSNSNNSFARWSSGTYTNCFTTLDWGTEISGKTLGYDADNVSSGLLCYTLNGNESGGEDWKQTLPTDSHPYPGIFDGHAEVYANGDTHCDGTAKDGETVTYSNTEGENRDEHDYQDGFCSYCNTLDEDYLTLVDGYYEINSMNKLHWFSQYVIAGNPSANAKLTADITMESENQYGYTPIGSAAYPYTGHFDGQGYSVTLNINNPGYNYQGLFGIVTDGVFIEKVIVKGTVTGYSYVGGIVGGTNGGSSNIQKTNIWYCGNEATITANGANGAGIIGVNMNGSASIILLNCYNTGNVTSGSDGGAISGWLGGGWSSVRNCYNNGTVKNGENVSKAFGRNNGCNFTNCYYTETSGTDNSTEDTGNGSPSMVADESLASGALCAKLGFGFRQDLGTDTYPNFAFDHGFVAQISDAGYSTMYNIHSDVTIPDGVEAYAGVVNVNGSSLSLVTIENKIAASEPVVLKLAEGTEAGLFNFMPTSGASKTASNSLSGSNGSVTGGTGIYALAKKGEEGNEVVGFYPVGSTVTIPEGKAYLEYSGSSVKGFNFVFEEDDPTAIEMVNGQSSMVNGSIFNLAGQRIQKMQKGINIVNGKKVLK